MNTDPYFMNIADMALGCGIIRVMHAWPATMNMEEEKKKKNIVSAVRATIVLLRHMSREAEINDDSQRQ